MSSDRQGYRQSRPALHREPRQWFWAQITDAKSATPYSAGNPMFGFPWAYGWKQIIWQVNPGAVQQPPLPPLVSTAARPRLLFGSANGGGMADDLGPAFNSLEIPTPATSVTPMMAIPVGTLVKIRREYDPLKPTSAIWIFDQAAPSGDVDLQIIGASGTVGAGTYHCVVVVGPAAGVDPTADFSMLDAGQTAPNPPVVYGHNLAESKMPAGVQMIKTDGSVYVRGSCVGQTKDGTNLYHFDHAFPLDVTLATDGGYNGTVSGMTVANASYTYTAKNVNGQTIGTMLSPLWARPPGVLVGAATNGRINTPIGGVIVLATTDEQGAVAGCATS